MRKLLSFLRRVHTKVDRAALLTVTCTYEQLRQALRAREWLGGRWEAQCGQDVLC